jgi:hypothetical protein
MPTARKAAQPVRPAQTGLAVDASWRRLYTAGAYCSFLYVLLVLVPLVLVFAAPSVPASGGAAVLRYIVSNKATYMTELVCFVGLSVPALVVFLAGAVALKHLDKSLAAIGALLGIASEIIALALGSSPQSLHGGLVVLADQYVSAAGAQQASLATAAESLIASTNAVSAAGILTAAGILVLSIVMLKGVFHRAVAWIGIATGALGIVSEAFRPMIGMAYIVYGLLLPAWFVLVGVKLLSFRREPLARGTAGKGTLSA